MEMFHEVQLWNVPRSQSTLESSRPRGMLSRDSGLPHNTRNTLGISGNVFESLPAQERVSPSLPSDPKNLASSHCEGVPGIVMR